MALKPPYLPVHVDEAMYMFPAEIRDMMPAEAEIPDDFWDGSNPWVKLSRRWFFDGVGADDKFYARDGIDPETAYRHLSCIQRSWQPRHQHKEASVAFLASLWFDHVTLGDRTYADAQ